MQNKELADKLGVSPSLISNLVKLRGETSNGTKRQNDFSGQLLMRALKAGIPIHYGELEFVALRFREEQISFLFEDGVRCDQSSDGMTVLVKRKGPASSSTRVQIKVAS